MTVHTTSEISADEAKRDAGGPVQVRAAFLSNDTLHPAINWSTLGPPMAEALRERGAQIVRPMPSSSRTITAEGFRRLRAVRSADAVFWMQLSSRPEWPIGALAAAAVGRRRAAYVIDAWPYVLDKVAVFARLLNLQPCFVAFREAYDALTRAHPDGRFVHLPFGADTRVFRRPPVGSDRDIHVMWMGRKHAPLHRAIDEYCRQRGYTYCAPKPGSIRDAHELGALVARAKYFVVTPPDLDHADRAGAFSPLVMRYLEGLAAGARLLGTLPRSGEFESVLPRAALLEVEPDGRDLADRLDADTDPLGWDAVASAAQSVHDDHSWDKRAATVWKHLEAHR